MDKHWQDVYNQGATINSSLNSVTLYNYLDISRHRHDTIAHVCTSIVIWLGIKKDAYDTARNKHVFTGKLGQPAKSILTVTLYRYR